MSKSLAQQVYERRMFNEENGCMVADSLGNPNRHIDHATRLMYKFAHTIPSSQHENFYEDTNMSAIAHGEYQQNE